MVRAHYLLVRPGQTHQTAGRGTRALTPPQGRAGRHGIILSRPDSQHLPRLSLSLAPRGAQGPPKQVGGGPEEQPPSREASNVQGQPVVALSPQRVHRSRGRPKPQLQSQIIEVGKPHWGRSPPVSTELHGSTLWSHPFASQRFHVLLNSLFKVLFNFPSRYLFAIGLVPVFSLGWSLPPYFGLHSQATRL